MSFVDKSQLEPGCAVLLHNKALSIVGTLADDVDPMVSVMKARSRPIPLFWVPSHTPPTQLCAAAAAAATAADDPALSHEAASVHPASEPCAPRVHASVERDTVSRSL